MNHHQARCLLPDACRTLGLLLASVIIAVGLPAATALSAEAESPEMLSGQATGAFTSGQFEEAIEHYDAAASAYAESGDASGQIGALLGKGNAYLALGRYADATAALEDAHTRAKQLADADLLAATGASLGNGYLLAGRTDEAGILLGTAIADARASERWNIAALAASAQGNRLASMGRIEIAIETYREALQDAAWADDPLTVAKTRVNIARALQTAERFDPAREELLRAVAELTPLPPSHEQAYALVSAGRLLANGATRGSTSGDDLLRANRAFQAGAASAEAIDDRRALSYALGYQSDLYERSGRTEDALLLARQATFAAQRANAPEILYRWQWAVGRLLAEQGDVVAAIESYERAVYTLNTVRPDLVGGYRAGQASFREEVGPLFLELADLELQQAVVKTEPAEREASLLRVRETVETLKGVELADYFQDDCVAALKSRTVGIDKLADRTAAIYPIIFDDRIELLVSLPSGTKLYTTHVTSDEVEKVVKGFRGALERRITHQYRRPSRQVYDWLIRPIAADLDRKSVV